MDATDAKVSKDAAGYQGPESGPFHCGNCLFFDRPSDENNQTGACLIVEGLIDELGCCNLFDSANGDGAGNEAFWREVHELTGEFLAKLRRVHIDTRILHPKTQAAKHALQSTLSKIFRHQKAAAITEASKLLHKVDSGTLRKAEKTPEEIADAIYDALRQYFDDLPDDARQALEEAARSGVSTGIAQLNIDDADVINAVNEIARDWAADRAAEMVGMRRTEDGGLIPNPKAEWQITETTRDEIKRLVTSAFESETPLDDLIGSIQTAGAFSDSRAEMIARTEVSLAQNSGNYEVWKASGSVAGIQWLLSEDHEIPCACEDNEDEIAEIGEPFPSGSLMPPEHPNCWCVVRAVFAEEMGIEDKAIHGLIILKGGDGSGNWGHEGREGELGGSAPGGGIAHVLVNRIKSDGGFTYSPVSHTSPKSGYALSIDSRNERIIDLKHVNTEKIRGVMAEYKPALASDKRAHIGGWYDPKTKKVYLDVSIVTKNKATALKLAKEHNQLAIFDLGRGKAIATGIKRAEEIKPAKLIRFEFDRECTAGEIRDFLSTLDLSAKKILD